MAQTEDDDLYTVEDMRHWLKKEVLTVMKGAELRVRDATDFVTDFATGKISAEEATRRMGQYDQRWTDAVPGVWVDEKMSDKEILRKLDHERGVEKNWQSTTSRDKGARKKGL